MVYDFDDQDEDLDDDLLQKFSSKLESAINDVITDNLDMDPRLELLTTLVSFAAQVSQDLGIDQTKFIEISTEFYQQAEEFFNEEHLRTIDQEKKIVLN